MKIFLKVKIKSLAAEATIIRREERRHKGDVKASLHLHRTIAVRSEARATLLAYGFLRGRPLKVMEASSREAPPWPRVEAMVKKYGYGDMRDRMQTFSEWKDA